MSRQAIGRKRPANLNLYGPWNDGYKALRKLSEILSQSGFDRRLAELVKVRASQMNGCAYCIDMHTKNARVLGETEQRLYALNAWRDTPFFSSRERAALALTEATTAIADGVGYELLEEAERHFTPEELSQLVFIIVLINSWNRLAITGRLPVGDYQPQKV